MKSTSWLNSLKTLCRGDLTSRRRRVTCGWTWQTRTNRAIQPSTIIGELLEDRSLLASVIGMDMTGGATFTSPGTRTAGYQFSTSRPLVVDGLGVFDVSGNGLVQSHQVGLYRMTGTTLRVATVPAAVSGTLVSSASAIGDWRVADITPIELAPGDYAVGAFYSTGSPDQIISNAAAVPISGVTFTVARFNSAPGLAFPVTPASGDNAGYFGATFRAAEVDYGDAPTGAQSGFAGSYPTAFADNGARHIIGGPRLGASVSADNDGQPNDTATGDTDNGVSVAGTVGSSFIGNRSGQLILNLQNADATANQVDAWIDFNRDGDWDDAGEQILTNVALGTANGTIARSFTVPQDIGDNFVAGDSYCRVRLSTAGGLAPTGLANDGEVEDFRVALVNINAAPTVANAIADQIATEDVSFSFQFAAETFADTNEGDVLTLTATQSNGDPLPNWLTFTPATRTFAGTPAGEDAGDLDVTVTATDLGNTSASDTFRISVAAINDVPSFVKGPNLTATGDGVARTLTGWATGISQGAAHEASQAVDFLVTIPAASAALFDAAPAISAHGTLTFTPKAAATGVVTVTAKIHDDGGTANGGVDTSAAQTFTITLTGLNKIPSFAKGPNQTLNEDAGAQTIVAWAKSVSAGTGDLGQTVQFVVTNNNTALFSSQPAISPTGTLTYTPAANVSGSATVTVVLKDDGGTAGGGKDATAPVTFTIMIKPVNDAPVRTEGTLPTITVEEDSTNATAVPVGLTGLAYVPGPASATDEAAQTLTFKITAIPKSLTLIKADGTTAVQVNGVVTAAELAGLKFKTVANLFGTAPLTFAVIDSGSGSTPNVNTLTQTINVTVNPINDGQPTISNIVDQITKEDTPTAVIKFTVDDPDDKLVNLNGVVVTATSSNTNLVPNSPANIVIGGSLGSRTIQLKPALDQVGTTTITVTATDSSGATATDTFVLTVTPVNDAPRVTVATLNIPEFTTNDTVVGTVAAVDPEGNAVTSFAITGGNTGNAFKIDAFTGVIRVNDASKIDFEALAKYTLTIKATDTLGAAGTKPHETGPVTINVQNQSFALTVAALDADNTLTVSRVGNNLVARRGLVDVITPTSLEDVASLTINGGSAKDTVILDASLNSAGSPATKKFTGQIVVNGNAGDDRLDASRINVATFGLAFDGGADNDTALGGAGHESLSGGDGDDLLKGGKGNDSINGGSGNDAILGTDGDDQLNGDAGNDTIIGGVGNDVLHGNSGDDTLIGGLGADQILGDAGTDIGLGGKGASARDGNGATNAGDVLDASLESINEAFATVFPFE